MNPFLYDFPVLALLSWSHIHHGGHRTRAWPIQIWSLLSHDGPLLGSWSIRCILPVSGWDS